MDKEKVESYILKILPLVLTLATVIIGVWQFNKGQKANAESRDYQFNMQILSKFKENQQKVYSETMGIVGYLSNNTSEFKSPKYIESFNRLNQLCWVDLVPVQSRGVDTAMIYFKNDLDNLFNNDFRNINEKQMQLMEHTDNLIQAIRMSIMDWSLPGGLIGLGGKYEPQKIIK
jgi:hypothetical protein